MRGTMMLVPLAMLGACNMGQSHDARDVASGQNGRRDFQVGTFDRVELAG